MAEATKYIAHISLDFLNTVFAYNGWQDNEKKQYEFVDKLMNDVNNFIKTSDSATLKSWKWYDDNGIEHAAIELIPVRVSDEDALFVTQEQWQELKKILTEQNK